LLDARINNNYDSRVTLINSVLSPMPIFYLSLFKMPTLGRKKIVKIHINFLWIWGQEGRKIAWVNWKTICNNKEQGGLGVKVVKSFNIAFLGKWKWRLDTEDNDLWKQIL